MYTYILHILFFFFEGEKQRPFEKLKNGKSQNRRHTAQSDDEEGGGRRRKERKVLFCAREIARFQQCVADISRSCQTHSQMFCNSSAKRESHRRRGLSLSLVERLNLIRVVTEKKKMMTMMLMMFFSAPLSHGINPYEDIKK